MCIVVYQNGSLVSYIDEGQKKVKITKNVLVIEKHAFQKNPTFNKVKFTNNLREIKTSAFESTKVESLKFPKTLRLLDKRCCYNCQLLKEITLNEGLATIRDQAFGKCAIKSVVIPSSVTTIGNEIFSLCENLEKITFANKSLLENISPRAFGDCLALREIEAPASLKDLLSTLDGLPATCRIEYK